MPKLSGAVSDADSMAKYLEANYNVPSNQIVNIRDKQATREGILTAFKNLRDNPRIKRDDAIVIYYAGHGGIIDGKETRTQIQTLIPVDYDPNAKPPVPPIPDRTFAAILDGLANKHGNNIVR